MVKQAVSTNLINSNRYESYLRIMGDLLDDKDYDKILIDIKKTK